MFFNSVCSRYYRRKVWFLLLIRFCCFINVVSVCMNTPQTFKKVEALRYVTLGIDIVTGLILACEALIKILHKGFIKQKKAYLKSPGRVFEFVMVICIAASVGLQAYEITKPLDYIIETFGGNYLMISFVRVPRPLLLLRVMKSVLNLSLPKTVSYRSMKQIWGVLLFTLYFLILSALIGVQIFGLLNSYCIREGANPKNISATDLMIPSTRCPHEGITENAFKCPKGFICEHLEFDIYHTDRRPFHDILTGILTVYEASSMEGWSTVMFNALDTRFFLFVVVYFFALILFISVMVKNVFIAIITEAFADLRLQVSKSQVPQQTQQKEMESVKVLRKTENSLHLEHKNEVSRRSWIKQVVFRATHSMVFQILILCLVFADAILQSFFNEKDYVRYLQIAFTVLFDLEALLKIIGLGRRNYFQSSQCQFEFLVCIGSSICLPLVVIGKPGFVVFQVLRPFRIVLVFGTLRSFLKRILGSGKKIGSLVIFTIAALAISAGIILQLFCGTGLKKVDGTEDGYSFAMFHTAVKALFQIFMTEAWVEVMDDVLFRGGFGFSILVYLVFIIFHLLAATILISVFVALVLDNLELTEEVKIAKQRRLGEEVADTQEKLPARMRFYQKLKPQPKLTKIDYVETTLPKIRQSFVTNYVSKGDQIDEQMPLITQCSKMKYKKDTDQPDDILHLSFLENKPDPLSVHQFRKQSSVSALMQDSYNKRLSIHSNNNEHALKRQKSFSKSIRRGLTRNISGTSSNSSGEGRTKVREQQMTTGLRRGASNQNKTSASSSNERYRNISNASGGVDRMKDIDVGVVRQKLEEAQRKKDTQIEYLRENHPLFDKSLFTFSANNPVRQFVHKLVHTRYDAFSKDDGGHIGGFSPERMKRYLGSQTWLDWIMLMCTWVSLIAMFDETPNRRTFDSTLLSVIEYIFVISSTIELALRIIADGLIFAPNAFIRNIGSVLHVFIYVVSLIYLCWKPEVIPAGSAAQVLLVLRALRPIRLITLAPPLRKVVVVLVSGYKDIVKVAFLQVVLMFVFASYGVQYLGGRLKRCNDRSIFTENKCNGVFRQSIADPRDLTNIPGKNISLLVPRIWRNPRNFDFDTMSSAFLALLEVLSLEGWTEVRDIIEEQVGFWGSIYPHVYVFCAGLIGLTLFIGVIVSNFNENKGTALLTVEQKRWKDLKKKIFLAQPLHLPSRPPEGTFRLQLFQIFIGKFYNRCYAIVILINCGTLCFGQWVPTELEYINYLTSVSIACCVVFVVDTLLKIYTFRWSGYWLSWRNRLDFFLMLCGVIFSLLNIILCHASKQRKYCEASQMFGVAVFVLRFLSLSGKHNGLRMLMLTVVMSMIKSFYTIGVLVCILICYAFVGVILFGTVKPGLAINRTVNFRKSYYAMFVLFRITTGEDWNKIMHDTTIQRPYCVERPEESYWFSNCGNRTAALIYFHSYYLIVSYIFLNLFIAVVIENFSIFYSTDDDPIMSQQDIQCFQETWNQCDEDKSGFMSLARAKVVLRLLQGGLSLENLKKNKPLLFKRMCAELEKPKTAKNITFHNLLFVLAYNKIDIAKSLQLDERLQREELEYVILEEVATETIRNWVTHMVERSRREKKPKSKLERKLSGIIPFFIYYCNTFT